MKNERKLSLKSFLKPGVSIVGVLMTTLLPFQYANAQQADAEEVVEEIIVQGQRLANQKAIDQKRRAKTIIDSLAADELGKLPDQNLAETLSRVPGLQAFQDEGAGLYVGIRGLNQEFVNVTVDGVEVSSASRPWDPNLRGTNLEAVPSTFVRNVNVIKSVTPDLDGDAIVGTVNLETRSAFDQDDTWFGISGSGGQYNEEVAPDDVDLSAKGNLSFGTRFGSEQQFGLVVDANIREVHRDNLKPDAYWRGGANHPDPNILAREIGGYFYQREESSLGVTAKLEFRPDERFEGFISGSWFDSEVIMDKTKHALLDGDPDVATGTFTGGAGTVRNDKVTYGVDGATTFMAGLDWAFNDQHSISGRLSRSDSKSYQDNPRMDYYNGTDLNGAYDWTGSHYDYRFDDASYANFTDVSQYGFGGIRRFEEELEKEVSTARIDYSFTPLDDEGFGFQAGAKLKRTEIDYGSNFFRWRNPNDSSADFGRFLSLEDWRFERSNNPQTMVADIEGALALALDLGPSAFGRIQGWTNARDYEITEEVMAFYGAVSYSGERFSVIGGVRHEQTDTDADNRITRDDDAPFTQTTADYSDLLPSIAVNYFPSDNWVLRFGASRTVGRPDVRDLARGESPVDELTGDYSRGNPDLKPRRSTNFDVSAEYYFDEGNSLVSVALFRKDIEDEIYDVLTEYPYTDLTGVQGTGFISQPDNVGDAEITGVELSFVKGRFDSLPAPFNNLGLSANITYNDGEVDLVSSALNRDRTITENRRTAEPAGLADVIGNITLFYEGKRISGRIAYRYVGSQTQRLSASGNADLLLDDYQQIDLQATYRLTDNFEVLAEVWNLTEEDQEFTNANFVRGTPNWYEFVQYGRAVWFGLSYKYTP